MDKLTIFLRRISRHGLHGTVRLIPVNIKYAWYAMKPAVIAKRRRERSLDRELGIDTAGIVPGGAVESEAGYTTAITFYQPVPRETFEEMLDCLPADTSSFCFIDIGSGKGRALVLAAQRIFAEVIGVELSRRLHRTAERNVARVRASLRTPIRILNLDARVFIFPGTPTVAFFFNPFGEEVMREVVRNIEYAHCNSGAPAFLLYLWPLQENVLQERGMWREIGGGRNWKVFRFVGPRGH